jgi:hypothetical protein
LSATNSTQWFWSDWAGDPCVRRLTPAERGLWIDLLNYAATGAPVGYVCDQHGNPISYEEIARFTNATPTEVATLIDGILAKGAASRDRTGRLFNRRMVRQAELSVKRKNAGKGGGKATQLKWREYQSLAQQVPRTLPGHRVPVPLPKESKITTSFSEAARASAEGSSQLVASLERASQWSQSLALSKGLSDEARGLRAEFLQIMTKQPVSASLRKMRRRHEISICFAVA